MASSNLQVYFVTNRSINAANALGLNVHRAWWSDNHQVVATRNRVKQAYERKQGRSDALHWPGNISANERMQFLPETRDSEAHMDVAVIQAMRFFTLPYRFHSRSAADELMLLSDADVVVQCSAAEFAKRFDEFGVPLVVQAELSLWPYRAEADLSNWPTTLTGLRFPNPGGLLGTRAGFAALIRALRMMPAYPCCPRVMAGSCTVDVHHCLQVALLSGQVPYALDTNASLWLALRKHNASRDLVKGLDGRLVYVRTGRVPCVLHFNSWAKTQPGFTRAAIAASQQNALLWSPSKALLGRFSRVRAIRHTSKHQ
mmetsp:Transcript_23885/g.39500  ORF Transcript_23885/g.39500 Transcript_23885/m.39500 type:complete len:314 (+) Transcript_23885:29-970(+)|eukprot:CAMPEP_0119324184 /NCGR_PEP_ID=MMETSP1333-20130426/62534_1 /TAXON_ID=418940 /ORGANISM="Scyphosphaera apsteinii, Strain RCC1455" /LENGTH=313 /DNA_ID=CAMNT_0007331819 /DNA_START=29 /DNA_END=970 /DNA_ORIENTATION=-